MQKPSIHRTLWEYWCVLHIKDIASNGIDVHISYFMVMFMEISRRPAKPAREAMFLKEQIEEQQKRKQMEKADKKNLG